MFNVILTFHNIVSSSISQFQQNNTQALQKTTSSHSQFQSQNLKQITKKSDIFNNPNTNILTLAKLIQDDKTFQDAFDNSVKQQQQSHLDKFIDNQSPVTDPYQTLTNSNKKKKAKYESHYGDEQIAQLMEQVRYFEIDGRKFEFQDEDEIFYRETPCESRNVQNGHSSCLCCETKFKTAKSAHYWQVIITSLLFHFQNTFSINSKFLYTNFSEFCGYPFCKLCLLKTLPFPKNNPDYKNRGQICKICDRKFFVRDFIKSSKQQIEVQALAIKNLQTQLTQKDQECQQLDAEQALFLEKVRIEKDKIKERKQDLKRQKKYLENECQSMGDECKQLFQRMNVIEAEQEDIEETIKILKDELDEIEEKLLRVDLNIRQVATEKTRMEEDLKRYTKLGKQPTGKNAKQKQPQSTYHASHSQSMHIQVSDSNKNSLVDSHMSSSTHSNNNQGNNDMKTSKHQKSTGISDQFNSTNSMINPASAQTDSEYLNNSSRIMNAGSFHMLNTIGSPVPQNERLNTLEGGLGDTRMSVPYKKMKSSKVRGPQQQSCCAENNSCNIY